MANLSPGEQKGRDLAAKHIDEEEYLKEQYNSLIKDAENVKDKEIADTHRRNYKRLLSDMRKRHEQDRAKIGLDNETLKKQQEQASKQNQLETDPGKPGRDSQKANEQKELSEEARRVEAERKYREMRESRNPRGRDGR